jgi:hypothetical protein
MRLYGGTGTGESVDMGLYGGTGTGDSVDGVTDEALRAAGLQVHRGDEAIAKLLEQPSELDECEDGVRWHAIGSIASGLLCMGALYLFDKTGNAWYAAGAGSAATIVAANICKLGYWEYNRRLELHRSQELTSSSYE